MSRIITVCFLTILSINTIVEGFGKQLLGQCEIVDIKKEDILEWHNDLRQKVARGEETEGLNGIGQPPSTCMPNLTWSDELAAQAEVWAKECIFDHGPDVMELFRNDVGQNVGYIKNSNEEELIFMNIVQAWYDEVKSFDASAVPSYKPSAYVTTHYSQLVWARTKSVGCAAAQISSEIPGIFLVCNYGPKANNVGEEVYEIADGGNINSKC